MNILKTILADQRERVKKLRSVYTYKHFEEHPNFSRPLNSLCRSITSREFGIIAEIKRSSPSGGAIRPSLTVSSIAHEYEKNGAAGISVLTNERFFSGSRDDLLTVNNEVSIPVLRKDFIVDEIQLFEAKAFGADAILLITEALTKEEILHLTLVAQALDLEVLAEVHAPESIEKLNDQVNLIGVNNRDLKRQCTDLTISEEMIRYLPSHAVHITESGIRRPEEIQKMAHLGYRGALIGEHLLRASSPGEELKRLQLKPVHHAD